MNKKVLFGVVGIALAAVLAFAVVPQVFAQAPTPETQQTPAWGSRGWMMGGGVHPMHEYMEEAVAGKLGITEEDLEKELASGKTMWQVAEERGFTQDEFLSMMREARSQALDKMVADGVITQAQADWMKDRGNYMLGKNGCPMGGLGRNGGRGQGMMNRPTW
ncbi:hypothetical protein ATHL_01605 [Anaerolinea thermolimosa]|uniref:hypothetical protein n=1 Tax=Anaerolinea thermolimosa TaxID=229919 RepID=UPI000781F897|nr:hypothetical protein [Anaerolinea thermolimosa]GAP06745.1 hypothetical protein ATHL_01605 [Anaerolinea thermolimosa]